MVQWDRLVLPEIVPNAAIVRIGVVESSVYLMRYDCLPLCLLFSVSQWVSSMQKVVLFCWLSYILSAVRSYK
jgi:hypothetical protein